MIPLLFILIETVLM